jgi:AcrR family transcriptional regulator
MRNKLLAALREAARHSSPNLPSEAEVARAAAVTVLVVREHLGTPENYEALLSWQSPAHETRNRILESAIRVFGRNGFQKATLDAVAADAGMTKGAIYWHFKSKNDLFFAMLDQRFQQETAGPMRGDMELLLKQAKDPLPAMTQMFAAGFYRVVNNPEWAQLHIECLSLVRHEDVRERFSAFYDQVWSMSTELTKELQSHGILQSHIDPEVAAIFWSALFDGLVMAWLVKGESLDWHTLMTKIFAIIWQGISPEGYSPSFFTEEVSS